MDERMNELQWIDTKVDLDIVDWRGNPVHLKDVPAIKNAKTGKVRLYPSRVSRAEIETYAKEFGLEARDVALMLTLFAKPGAFKEGYLPTGYHLNKTLFYIWKDLESQGLGDAFPRDEFVAADRGPVPKNLKSDGERLQERGLVSIQFHRWGPRPKDQSIVTELTPSGTEIAKQLWEKVAEPFKLSSIRIKERIFPLDPKSLRERVHRDFPEYKKTYVELDTE